MSSRDEYLRAAGVTEELYADPRVRMRGIFRTASAGALSLDDAGRAWEAISAMRRIVKKGAGQITRQSDYDALVVATALKLANDVPRINFGVGQKMVNLFMKDQWALGHLPKELARRLHAPLDRTVVSKLQEPLSWGSWTRVEAASAEDQTVADYLAIQKHLRDLVKRGAVPFTKVIELEQFIWQRI
jgi:hypothetical protein